MLPTVRSVIDKIFFLRKFDVFFFEDAVAATTCIPKHNSQLALPAIMATRTPGRQAKPQKQNKTDSRQQKRKRDQDDLQQLEQAVADLVCRCTELALQYHDILAETLTLSLSLSYRISSLLKLKIS